MEKSKDPIEARNEVAEKNPKLASVWDELAQSKKLRKDLQLLYTLKG